MFGHITNGIYIKVLLIVLCQKYHNEYVMNVINRFYPLQIILAVVKILSRMALDNISWDEMRWDTFYFKSGQIEEKASAGTAIVRL